MAPNLTGSIQAETPPPIKATRSKFNRALGQEKSCNENVEKWLLSCVGKKIHFEPFKIRKFKEMMPIKNCTKIRVQHLTSHVLNSEKEQPIIYVNL